MELNPNHPVTTALRTEWHKLLAIAMHKLGYMNLHITEEDVERFAAAGCSNIAVREVAQGPNAGIHLILVDDSLAASLARGAGGLPT